MKLVLIIAVAAAMFNGAGCSATNQQKSGRPGQPEVKSGIVPVADSEVAIVEMENVSAYGSFKIELYSNIAPKAVARFKELANEGVYNGTSFHRINPSVVQGGDPLSKDDNPDNDGTGKSNKPNVEAEFSDIPYDTGIVGAARSQDFNSANSQFFITLKREAGFDKKYTVFGKVIEGMNNVRTISAVQPKNGERPVEAVRIKSIRFEPMGQK